MSDHRPVSAEFTVDVSLTEMYFAKSEQVSDMPSQADLYDTEEVQDSVRTLFNQVDDLQNQHVHDRGELKIKDAYLDFEKITYVHHLILT